MHRSASIPWVVTILAGWLAASLLTATSAAAGGVSPGDPERFAGVRDGCPTFTWEASPGAGAFELVAFALPPTPPAARTWCWTARPAARWTP